MPRVRLRPEPVQATGGGGLRLQGPHGGQEAGQGAPLPQKAWRRDARLTRLPPRPSRQAAKAATSKGGERPRDKLTREAIERARGIDEARGRGGDKKKGWFG